LSVSETKSSFERAKPGRRALLWLLNSDAVRSWAYLTHPTFLRAVSHCLIAEDGLKYLLQWILVEDNPLSPATAGQRIGKQNAFWRGSLLLHTMEAQAYWTENDLLLEDSVDTWQSLCRRASDQGSYISPALSAKWTNARLTVEGGERHLSSTKFDEFVHSIHFWLPHDQDEVAFKQAHLLLHHPDGADTSAFLDILKRNENATSCKLLAPTHEPGNRFMFSAIGQLARQLAQQGLLRDAHWALDFGREHMPELFSMRKVPPSRPYEGEGDYRYTRKATKTEIADGRADEHGRVKASLEFWRETRNLRPDHKPVFGRGG
jgi:hypothetical protein